MTATTIANLQIVPSKFAEYILERTTEKSALVRSGIAVSDPTVSQIINGSPKGGNIITMPYYKPLTGEDEVFGEEELGIDNVDTDSVIAALLIRQKAWGDTDLSRVMGGTDPLAAIANLASDWWIGREQAIIIATLNGILDPSKGALKAHVLDVSNVKSTDCVISVDNTLDAKNLMGDAADKLGMVFMHSATYTQLQKQQKIETEYNSDLKVKINTYLGYEVTVDDGLPCDTSTGTYTTYFMGKGAFARNDGMPQHLVGVETDRQKLKALNILINRRALVMHPNGLSWNANAALTGGKKYAANADLEKPANWTLKKDHKNIPIVALKHNQSCNDLGTITISVQGTSPQKSYLIGLANAGTLFDIWVLNKSIDEKVGGSQAMVKKTPELGQAAELDDREFEIQVFDYTVN